MPELYEGTSPLNIPERSSALSNMTFTGVHVQGDTLTAAILPREGKEEVIILSPDFMKDRGNTGRLLF